MVESTRGGSPVTGGPLGSPEPPPAAAHSAAGTEPAPTATGQSSGEFVQSLARGLAVIRAFDAEHPRRSLSDIARATGLTRATARRFLLTLEELGYVRSDGRDYSLTPRVLELGFSYLSSLTLPEVAQPHLERLSRTLDESTSASVLDGSEIVYIARVPTRRIMSVSITIGTRFPAFTTSMGRVLLAGLAPSELDRMLALWQPSGFTAATITEPAALRSEIARVREQGWAMVDQELDFGLRSFAAPIHQDGRVVAAINVSTAAGRRSAEESLRDIVPPLLEAARSIEADLAHY
ncbi:IclR family transcriptional regulator domain-containing protein [Ruicaihuangia caeni]|uniref:Glycerol operon regulatory protein n=1 Tax=Ruicaihuangia caeni TaxID=3042517 RepID=A0AAW6TAC5_9MICO|nr:IclR family transcriptional regulator C-terminal domain-containing protein [Klugiella sp. YN-L-19]MDI2099298.1 IclR family transcriptional regulator C-terminal domain-containing protein [Klugiella sp. YN-L-19]